MEVFFLLLLNGLSFPDSTNFSCKLLPVLSYTILFVVFSTNSEPKRKVLVDSGTVYI